jgi:hypothetical protein
MRYKDQQITSGFFMSFSFLIFLWKSNHELYYIPLSCVVAFAAWFAYTTQMVDASKD